MAETHTGPSHGVPKALGPSYFSERIHSLWAKARVGGDAPFSVWNESRDNSNMLLTEVTATEKMSDYREAEWRSTKQRG